MISGDFIGKIQQNYSIFTKAEKRVADYILQNNREVLFLSISDLADACGVGDTSVFRFCRTMELQGYQEFKMHLSLSMNDGAEEEKITFPLGMTKINLMDSFPVMAQKVLQNNLSAVSEAYSLLEPEEFARAMYYFERSEQIYFYGAGSSSVVATAAMNKFLRITPNVHCMADTHMQVMQASMLTERELAVIISYSGETKDMVYVARLAKESGAKIICITRYKKSKLTSYSDVTILCGVNEEPLGGGSTCAQMSQLYLIDLLYIEYYKRKFETSSANNLKTSSAVIEKIY